MPWADDGKPVFTYHEDYACPDEAALVAGRHLEDVINHLWGTYDANVNIITDQWCAVIVDGWFNVNEKDLVLGRFTISVEQDDVLVAACRAQQLIEENMPKEDHDRGKSAQDVVEARHPGSLLHLLGANQGPRVALSIP